ncbi:MAG TPA: glucosyl-3-phosphoglycerate synthase [Tetrasphaera sp.]|uniref:glucosyl-3-phosphoglycerate synthase n=1 Tax=Nostocoides sp. TaxID=1917966 RepID=UPI002B5A43B8|nr:glucosyl-3-phosphoglycerate synthase [Tetrasphaera sp.]HNQ07702.1 glucosyl-3-phosphoglycerate synthase [Tetrasphaera sp.]
MTTPRPRIWRPDDWALDDLVAAKASTRVSVVIPARDEQDSVAAVVTGIAGAWCGPGGLVDEIVVIDSDSIDATAERARAAGAKVFSAKDIRPEAGPAEGKGEALWKAAQVAQGDLLVFVDADLVEWGAHFVPGLLGPLLTDPGVHLVKAVYDRPMLGADGHEAESGGRVTELVARPLLALHWPDLAHIVQPLAGEWAIRRRTFAGLSVPMGYGVEIAALIDVAEVFGAHSIAQVDLGRRTHRNRRHDTLGPMALQVLAAAEVRLGSREVAREPARVELRQFDLVAGGFVPRSRFPVVGERPPIEPGAASRAPSVLAGSEQPRDVPRSGVAALVRADAGKDATLAPVNRVASAARSQGAGTRLRLGRHTYDADARLVMAIVNRTPDSFYDKGLTWTTDAAKDRVVQVVEQGADIVDIGGIKAAPGHEIDATEEKRRVVDFVAWVRGEFPDLVISVDTWRSEVARAVCAVGADLINDAWGGYDPLLPEVAAEFGSALVCTHTGGVTPRTRPFRIEYDDVVADIVESLLTQANRAVTMGVDPERIIIDPAHDFGKNTWHSLAATRQLDRLVATGWPVLVSLSNKDFVGETLDKPVGERLIGTLATTAISGWLGAQIYRVHEVAETRQVLDMVSTIAGQRLPSITTRGLQ